MDISNKLNYDPHDEWRATNPNIHICYCSLCNHLNSTVSRQQAPTEDIPWIREWGLEVKSRRPEGPIIDAKQRWEGRVGEK